MKTEGTPLLQSVDMLAAADLQEEMGVQPTGKVADIRTGLQCYLLSSVWKTHRHCGTRD
jgi:hypothetical protein